MSETVSRPGSGNASEREWIIQSQQGDTEAFGHLVQLYQERVYAVAFQMCHNHSDADEWSQEAFVKAFQSMEKFRSDSSFYTWIYRITVNLCLTHLKNQKRTVPLPDAKNDDDHHSPELGVLDPTDATMESSDVQLKISKALEELSPDLRAAVVLVYLQEMSPREAGSVLGCAEATVHWRLFRARKQLKKFFDGQEGGL